MPRTKKLTTSRRTTSTTRRTKKNTGPTNRTTTTRTNSGWPCGSPKYRTARNECTWRLGSYRNLYQQFNGAGKQTYFSPTVANKWIKFVDKGYRIYKFSNKEFTQHFGTNFANNTPTTCYRNFKQKYGAGIKGVTRGKGGCWLVAATQNVNARPFSNYTWK